MTKIMAHYDQNWIMGKLLFLVVCCSFLHVNATGNNDPLTACQHLQQAESRRAKSLDDFGSNTKVTVPKCTPQGEFEKVQCSNEINGTECWCVDDYGVEITGTRKTNESDVKCDVDSSCPAHSCRMYCPGGFARSPRSGCPICQCRDPCEGVVCPGGLQCQPQEVNCKTDPCPPVPTCKKARSLSDLCPAGQPLTITDTIRPFLCGNDAGKPTCPPLYKCLVQGNNDYGVCCPAAIGFKKPGECPNPDDVQSSPSTGRLCGAPCSHDLECPQMEKCCQSNGCGTNCRRPFNVTTCHQARMLTEILSVNEREGRGYIPECEGPSGTFSEKQCSRNGLVCWCVEPQTGNKIKGSMGAATMVHCEGISNMIVRSQGRSADMTSNCDQNICASVCEYGFKPDHNGCPSCECSEPCEGFLCPLGTHCEVAKDPECRSGSALCASLPVCKPNFAYTNPCEIGVPLTDNSTGEVMYCRQDSDESEGRSFQSRSFFDEVSGRSMTNSIICPNDFDCVKLHKETESVCCPHIPTAPEETADYQDLERPQSMCEYLRDFSDRMEGTEAGMTLALPSPKCKADGTYEPMMCQKKTIKVTPLERRRILEEKNVRQMRMLLSTREKRSTAYECPLYKCVPCDHGYEVDENGCQTCKCKNAPNHQCPVYRCRGCEFGYKYDELGCMTCECLDGPKREEREEREATSENLRLFKVDESTDENRGLDVKSLIKYLRQNMLARSDNSEANYISEILSRKLLHQVVQERSAKVIDVNGGGSQSLDRGNTKSELKDKKPFSNQGLVEVEIDECWCVDNFGTEIPSSRGYNVTMHSCQELRDSLECLDLTCRMGCEYGFVLDPETKCPSCECRDPCDSVTCADGEECRSVEVTCIGEYCPPVPACLPKKNGQCPFLVPPGSDGSTSDSCEYDCRSDSHCEGTKRCCSNGCGTQCVEPQLKTACQHLKTIQLHQASELGVPPRQKYIAQCDEKDGSWKPVQCGPENVCWCVDQSGNELSGTRTLNGEHPNCSIAPKTQCPDLKCSPCEYGYVVDKSGCRTCECRMPCNEISCPGDEECKMMKVECIDEPCPLMPICVPSRESVCSEGFPYTLNDRPVSCGPQNDAEICPSTHTCQLDIESRKGVCCSKSRDVCFESVDSNCSAENVTDVYSRWRFSPKHNKCIPVKVNKLCQSKNLFHSEQACSSVCPVLSQCERLRLRNSLASKRSGQQLAFQPRCDPDTGLWSPIQCLGKPTELKENPNGLNRAFSIETPEDPTNTIRGVCWCADKKGAPVKGTLTRGTEPLCNHRQARRRTVDVDVIQDPVMEELIRQMTIMVDEDNFIETDIGVQSANRLEKITTTTEHILEIANSIYEESAQSSHSLIPTNTRCNALKATASFTVACNNGAFEPTQCNEDTCWCVDAAGNQISETSTFRMGTNKCVFTPIDTVAIELHLANPKKKIFRNVYDTLKVELKQLLGDMPDNLRVHENTDGNIHLRFDLTDDNKIDIAFALEEMVKQEKLILVNGELRPDITMSRFVHKTNKSSHLPVPQKAALIPESTFQTIVFILATTSAFLVSIFVVFIMLKRGKNKMKTYNTNKSVGMNDKFLDYSSPIFVLSANEEK